MIDKPSLASLYHEIVAQSSLARAIVTIYNNITTSKIAHFSLTPSMSLSLQIPEPTAISALPSSVSPQLPGLWLTTATSLPTDVGIESTDFQLSSHFGLLLLADLHTITADINAAASPIAAALIHYLRVSKSTKSFRQISKTSGLPIQDIQFLASHLIYWRRARAIPPLNQRDTYIVSPNADMRNLVAAASSFTRVFPSLPSLPKLMLLLSSTPRPYSTLIPSVDHKEVYMDILAWLIRGGWVTQLRTFAWIRVPPEVKGGLHTDGGSTAGKIGDERSAYIDQTGRDIPANLTTSPSPSSDAVLPLNAKEPSSPTIISNPRVASPIQSRYLSAISRYVEASQGAESQAAWNKCMKYLDGTHALESIAVSEGWKRKRTSEFVAGWDNLGILAKSRHW